MNNFDFIKNARSWDDVFKVLDLINKKEPKKVGTLFEIFCKHYLICKEEFKKVSLLNEVEKSILKKLNIEKQDHGCDLVVEIENGRYGAVQCKFTSDQENKILSWTGSNLSSFLASSTVTDTRIIFTNASGVAKSVIRKAQEKNYTQYSFQHLNELNEIDLRAIYCSIQGRKVKKEYFSPRLHQKQAIEQVVAGFKKESRGKVILPCGAGKTLTSLWIKEKLKPQKTLVLVPSLSLLRQFKNDWRAQWKTKSDFFCVCSEKDISGSDTAEINIFEIGGMVTTDPKEIRNLLAGSKPQIVYSTYQSSPRIAEAMKGTKIKFDLVICDEAHRTSGEKASAFATILDDSKIRASKRLFMTATPRIVSETVKNKLGNEEYKYLADMNDEDLYGKEFFYMNFGDAIKKKPAFLSDYKIIAVGVTSEEVESWIKERRFAKGTTVNDIAHNYALEKVMKKYKASHAITFHSRVSSALQFQNRHQEMYKTTEAFHVSGIQSSSDRAHDLKKFSESKNAVITNARCLTEGVDVPAIDMVYFCDPRSSKIDIVQATGRALRIHKGKKLGYIVVPLFHKKDANTEKLIEDGNYKILIQVVRAMADQDARIEEEIKSIKYGLGEKKGASKKIEIDFGSKSRIELLGFEEKLKESIFIEIISRSVVKWRPFKQAREFVHKLNLRNNKEWRIYIKSGKKPEDIPSNPECVFKSNGWSGYGNWLGTGYVHGKNRQYLTYNEARDFVHNLALKNRDEWDAYCKSGKKPLNIPANPVQSYKNKGWNGIGDWLGTGVTANFEKQFKPFTSARAFVHNLNLKNQNEWREYSKSGKKPKDLPSSPDKTYKNQGWKSYGDWLGTGKIADQFKYFLPIEEARVFVHKLKLNNEKEWKRYCKSGKKPDNIPATPQNIYKNKGWKNVGDWLGTGKIANYNKEFRSFKNSRSFVHNLKLRTHKEWMEFCKSGKKPEDIPTSPERTYKNHGWKGVGDWLGTGAVANQNKKFMTFRDARLFVHKLKLINETEWRIYAKSDRKPKNIPSVPHAVYKNKGWVSWGDWLGTKK